MKNPTDVPYFDDALLAWLDKSFPRTDVNPQTPVNDIMFAAGIQRVITTIRAHSNKQRVASQT